MIPFIIPFPDIDPAIFSFEIGSFTLALRWYSLAYIAGLLLGWRFVVRLVRKPDLWPGDIAPMSAKQAEDLLTWMILSVIVGGRLGFVLFYQPAFFLANPAEIMKVWQGGMSFHGGALGVVIGAALWCWRNKLSMLGVGDAIAAAVPIGLFFGRLANFINGELWGRPATVPWAVPFPGAKCPADWTAECAQHPSQLYEAGLEGIALFAVMAWLIYARNWLRVPGRLIATFLIGYGLARVFVENFRLADAQYITANNPFGQVLRLGSGPDALGLTMGMVLSLPMIAAGVLLLIWANRRAA